MWDIIITKHALEEYKKDNPKCKDVRETLRDLFIYFLIKQRERKVKYYKDYVKNAEVITVWYETIVFNDNVVITYYRTLPLKCVILIKKYNTKIKNIVNWKLQEQLYKKASKIKNKKIAPRKFYKYSKHKFAF